MRAFVVALASVLALLPQAYSFVPSPFLRRTQASAFARQSVVLHPTLIIQASSERLPKDKQDAFLSEATELVARELSKPESYVMITLNYPDAMSFGGKTDPAAFVYLTSIGRLGSDTNPKVTRGVSDLLAKYMGIPANRVFVQFLDSPAAFFGWNGNTFGS